MKTEEELIWEAYVAKKIIKEASSFDEVFFGDESEDMESNLQLWFDENDILDLDEIVKIQDNLDMDFGYLNEDTKLEYLWVNGEYFLIGSEESGYELKAKSKDDTQEWIDSIYDESELLEYMGLSEDDIDISGWGSTMRDFGGEVYHYTDEDSIEEIKESGELVGSSGTSLGNRHVSGIFCSVDPEEYADGTYGDVLLKIDLEKFKTKYGVDKLDVAPEPEIFECDVKNLFAHVIGFREYYCNPDSSSGVSGFTVIVGHKIPMDCITIVER